MKNEAMAIRNFLCSWRSRAFGVASLVPLSLFRVVMGSFHKLILTNSVRALFPRFREPNNFSSEVRQLQRIHGTLDTWNSRRSISSSPSVMNDKKLSVFSMLSVSAF
jgi:hypothetical protein